MIIERIQAENVLKYARLDLDEIPTNGLIAVIGDNESGKSSIGESVCFALFGRTFSLGPDELGKVIRWGESRCAIKLDFRTPDGRRYQVARFLDELGNHGASISRPGEQPMVRGIAAVAERLRDLIGFGYTELIESFYLAQREISTPKPHSDALKAMAGIDALERVAAECRRERDQTDGQRAETAREYADVAAEIQSLDLDEGRLPALENERARTQTALAADRERILALKARSEEVDTAIARVKEGAAAWCAVDQGASYAERRAQSSALAKVLDAVEGVCTGDDAARRAYATLAGAARAASERLAAVDALRLRALAYRAQLAAWLGIAAAATTLPSSATFAASSRLATGSSPRYSARAGPRRETGADADCPCRPIARTAAAASSSAAGVMSSEYAYAWRSPETARTPTPRSIEKLPAFTIPSSRLQLSKRACWK